MKGKVLEKMITMMDEIIAAHIKKGDTKQPPKSDDPEYKEKLENLKEEMTEEEDDDKSQ